VLVAPRLHVTPREINLGQLKVGQDHRLYLHLANQGMGLLRGSVSCEDCLWLSLGDAAGLPSKLFQFRNDLAIPVHVRGKQLRAGNKPLEGVLVIDSNGGSITVPVRAEVPVTAFTEGVLAGAITPRQVAEKARTSPREAAVLFENGAVARWYELNGWTYPVQGPAASGLGAVQQFFEALGLTSPPKVELSTAQVNFMGKVGERLEQLLEVRSPEKRPVYAYATSDQPWLQVGSPRLHGRTATIPLAVAAVPDRPGELFHARLLVLANGNQQFTVPVTLAIRGSGSGRPPVPIAQPAAGLAFPAGAGAKLLPTALGAGSPPPAPAAVTSTASTTTKGGHDPLPPVVRMNQGGPGAGSNQSPNRAPVGAMEPPPARNANAVQAGPSRPWSSSGHAPQPAPPNGRTQPSPPEAAPTERSVGCLGHLLPASLLLLLLTGVVARDYLLKPPTENGPPDVAEDFTLRDTEPRVGIRFHQLGDAIISQPSMRFGLVMLRERDPEIHDKLKRLTYDELGRSNNTCLRIDGGERLFGQNDPRVFPEPGGHWEAKSLPLEQNRKWRREGARSTWVYDDVKIAVTQTVEIVPGEQSHQLDTCLVRYRIENRGTKKHRVGIRFMLDTYIGANDGVPFTIPGSNTLCDTEHSFDTPAEVPDFIQALEHPSLVKPGTIAHLQFRIGGGVEAPDRVTLGAWPDLRMQWQGRPMRQQLTGWEVPVRSMKTLKPHDSAVVMYWNERPLNPGAAREVGFAYGLGDVASGEGHGRLAVTIGGSFTPGGEFTVTAYVRNPQPGQHLTLSVPEGFELAEGIADQVVPPLPPDASSPNSPVTWKVRAARRTGQYTLTVESSTGEKQSLAVTIRSQRIFD
jgi:hypothetical protein